MVKMCFGVNGASESGSLRLSRVSGRLLTMASASQTSVWKVSSSRTPTLPSRRAVSTLWTVRTCRSHTPPDAWLADGGFILKVTQSQSSLSMSLLVLHWSIACRASRSSIFAPMKFVRWSLRSCRTSPLLQMKRRKALINESVSKEFETSSCTALDAMHVKRAMYFFTCLRPSFTCHGPQ